MRNRSNSYGVKYFQTILQRINCRSGEVEDQLNDFERVVTKLIQWFINARAFFNWIIPKRIFAGNIFPPSDSSVISNN
jgi:hypothetical protein